MEQQLFILLFFTGVIALVLSVPRKYYLIQQGKTWSDAQAYCQANHDDLATIESDDDMVQLQNEAQSQQFSSSAWIGLYNDITSWRWSFENVPLGSMTKWGFLQPDNQHGKQECVIMFLSSWSDAPCTGAFPFVCFDDRNTGTARYIYFSDLKTWHEAQSFCRQYHTDLTSARDEHEQSVIVGKIPDPNSYTWIGLFRESWKWSDQTNLSTLRWMLGKPDYPLWTENCGYLYNSQVANALCSDLHPFFCHSVITGKKQIIRVKVWSNQNVNDPAVKEAILEMIHQKLMEHGMAENIMVNWREKPGGVVFQRMKENNNTVENIKKKACDL